MRQFPTFVYSLLLYPALVALLFWVVPCVGAEVIRFAPLPLEGRRILHEQFSGLVDYLAAETGTEILWVFHEDYGDILRAFREGEVDLAYLGPLPFVLLRRSGAKAESLGCFRDADGAVSYTCSLVAFGGEGIRPEAVHGMRIGLTQPYSTCGYLAVSAMLDDAGRSLEGDGNRYAYAGSHSKAALGVVLGEYQVAGVKTAIAERYAHMNLEVIAESPAYPGFTLAANTDTLSPELVRRLARAVRALDLERNPTASNLLGGWGAQIRNGAVSPTQCDYSDIAATLERLPWPIPGAGSLP